MSVFKAMFMTFCLLLGLSAPAFAAVDMFIKIEGIDGESKDSNHDKWIDVLSVSWGASSRAQDYNSSRSNRSSAKANHNSTRSNRAPVTNGDGHVTVLKRIDKSSPMLAKAASRRAAKSSAKRSMPDSFFDVFVDIVENGATQRYQLLEVRVNRIEMARTADGDPAEKVTMSYRSVKPVSIAQGVKADVKAVKRETASGMATGKRQHK